MEPESKADTMQSLSLDDNKHLNCQGMWKLNKLKKKCVCVGSSTRRTVTHIGKSEINVFANKRAENLSDETTNLFFNTTLSPPFML